MKNKVLLAVFGCVSAVLPLCGGVLDAAWIKGTTDRNPLFYRPGEKMVFTLCLQGADGALPDGAYFLDWDRSGDDGRVESGKVPLTTEPFVYETSLDRPGFVRLRAVVVDRKGRRVKRSYRGDPADKVAMNRFERSGSAVFFDGGAGVDIDTLKSHPEPEDFDAFWKRQYARLDLVPIKADTIELESPSANVRLMAVRIDCAGLRPVTGYLTVPRAVESGSTFPARLMTQGYGGVSKNVGPPVSVSEDEIVLRINAHGVKLKAFGATAADAKAHSWAIGSNGHSYAFDPKQNADPETAYFNGMVLRVKRGLQYLKTVRGWNGKDLFASGGSQGGLQTIWAAACGEGVTRAESNIPWCCDIYTNGKLRKDPSLKLAGDGWYVEWTEALGYYDAANFARRIPVSCRTIVTRAGLGDYCCPPAGVAKMWNNIPGNKEIRWMQGSRHGYQPPAYEGRDFVRE